MWLTEVRTIAVSGSLTSYIAGTRPALSSAIWRRPPGVKSGSGWQGRWRYVGFIDIPGVLLTIVDMIFYSRARYTFYAANASKIPSQNPYFRNAVPKSGSGAEVTA